MNIRFFVIDRPQNKTPSVTAWGLWLNDAQMRSLDAEVADEQLGRKIVALFAWAAYVAAAIIAGVGLWVRVRGRR